MNASQNLTNRLRLLSAGDPLIADAVMIEILPALHNVALRALKRDQLAGGISPTELINEVWVRNLHRGGWPVESHQHFYNLVGLAMRHVLVDLARQRLAERRGSGEFVLPLSEVAEGREPVLPHPELVIEVVTLMEQLERLDPLAAQVVDLHYFRIFRTFDAD